MNYNYLKKVRIFLYLYLYILLAPFSYDQLSKEATTSGLKQLTCFQYKKFLFTLDFKIQDLK